MLGFFGKNPSTIRAKFFIRGGKFGDQGFFLHIGDSQYILFVILFVRDTHHRQGTVGRESFYRPGTGKMILQIGTQRIDHPGGTFFPNTNFAAPLDISNVRVVEKAQGVFPATHFDPGSFGQAFLLGFFTRLIVGTPCRRWAEQEKSQDEP